MARRSGLGKGLSALIPTEVSGDRRSALREVPIANVRPNPYQPRQHFDEESMASLSASIRELGVLQPVLVRETGSDQFELIAGERRWRAARRAGHQTIPVLVQTADDLHSLEQALVENLHREDLNPIEEAAAYQQLIDEFDYTHEQVATRVGKSRAAVTNTLRLLQLPPGVQRALAEGALSAGHARALLGTPDRAWQESVVKEIVAEGLTVRAVESLVRQRTLPETGTETGTATATESGMGTDVGTGVGGGAAEGQPGSRRSIQDGAAGASGSGTAGARDTTASSSQAAPTDVLRRRLPAPGMLELEELLAAYLNTRVKVEMGGSRGRVQIEFATLEDLERIYKLMVGGGGR